jgi:hypothetical protein
MSTRQLETLSLDNTYARLPEKDFSVIDRLLTLSQDSVHPTVGMEFYAWPRSIEKNISASFARRDAMKQDKCCGPMIRVTGGTD